MPNTGRWLNRDPLQEAGGINLYAYVMGDPMGYVDPDGRYRSRPENPDIGDAAWRSPRSNSSCLTSCSDNTWKEIDEFFPNKSNGGDTFCTTDPKPGDGWKNRTNTKIKKGIKGEVVESIGDIFIQWYCDIKCI